MKQAKARIHRYQLAGGWEVLVGASDADNDFLSLQMAEADDWWFHVEAVPGSHVLLRAKSNQEPGSETLRQAAAIAAYHSKSRHAGMVSVHCTRARYVKKPRGAKPGTVQVSRGKILKVRPEIGIATRITAVHKAESEG